MTYLFSQSWEGGAEVREVCVMTKWRGVWTGVVQRVGQGEWYDKWRSGLKFSWVIQIYVKVGGVKKREKAEGGEYLETVIPLCRFQKILLDSYGSTLLFTSNHNPKKPQERCESKLKYVLWCLRWRSSSMSGMEWKIDRWVWCSCSCPHSRAVRKVKRNKNTIINS